MLPTRRGTGLSNILSDPFGSGDSRWNQLINRMFEDSGSDPALGNYPVDIQEDEDNLYVEAEMPGFNRDEIDVSLEGGILTICAERRTETDDSAEKQKPRTKHLSERRYSRIQRSFSLSDSVDEESVDASLSDGVLHLTLHKKPERQRRKIEVR